MISFSIFVGARIRDAVRNEARPGAPDIGKLS